MLRSFELQASFVVSLLLVCAYIIYELLAEPSGGNLFGHFLGIVGSVLMLMTETLYSARKRLGIISWGPVRYWLSFHIFTGIIGPALVLMHTALAFRGIAGLTAGLTALVVASGFLGRYIYTAVPRTLAGIEVSRQALEAEAIRRQRELERWAVTKSARVQGLVTREAEELAAQDDLTVITFFLQQWRGWRRMQRVHKEIRTLEKEEKERLADIEKLLHLQQRRSRQIRSLQTTRQMMSWWHTFHVPLGLTLFTAMFIHIIAALYYGGI